MLRNLPKRLLLKQRKLMRQLLAEQRKIKAKILHNGAGVYWWDDRKNFGDLVSSELLSLYGKTPILQKPQSADLIMVGSLIEHLPTNFSGIIMGSGLIAEKELRFEYADFLAVRGEYTRDCLGLDSAVVLGDFGLLAHQLLASNKKQKRYTYGIVPHYIDKGNVWLENLKKELGSNCLIINAEDNATSVTSKIAQCEMVFSSSLHGLIFADALSIPNVWIKLSDNVVGDGFKFRDYNSAIDAEQQCVDIKPSTTVKDLEKAISSKSPEKIEAKQEELTNIFKEYLKNIE
jgi:pyruvyltransferase